MYEWKVIEHLGTRTQGSSDEEKEKLLADGFQWFRTMFEDERSNIHFNVYRKPTKTKKYWSKSDITTNLKIKDPANNFFVIIQLHNQLCEMKGWLLFSPDHGVAYKPCDGYFSTSDIVEYLNDNGFTI